MWICFKIKCHLAVTYITTVSHKKYSSVQKTKLTHTNNLIPNVEIQYRNVCLCWTDRRNMIFFPAVGSQSSCLFCFILIIYIYILKSHAGLWDHEPPPKKKNPTTFICRWTFLLRCEIWTNLKKILSSFPGMWGTLPFRKCQAGSGFSQTNRQTNWDQIKIKFNYSVDMNIIRGGREERGMRVMRGVGRSDIAEVMLMF